MLAMGKKLKQFMCLMRNYRIKARQQNLVTSDLSHTWKALNLPLKAMPSDEQIETGEWYLFLESENDYVYVTFTKHTAHTVVFNKYGKF